MNKDVLIVVDMQNDFVYGALGSKDAQAIVKNVRDRLTRATADRERVIFTRDTHTQNYLDTREGKFLPVTHCVKDTDGWQIIDELSDFAQNAKIIDKPTFGSTELAEYLLTLDAKKITLIGVCTDICVVSNALLLKASLPETDICVENNCCAGVTPQKHIAAIETMKSCQIIIK